MNEILTGDFNPILTSTPEITGSIAATDVTVTGTSTETAGTVISVYQNIVLLGTTTVTSYGTWLLQPL